MAKHPKNTKKNFAAKKRANKTLVGVKKNSAKTKATAGGAKAKSKAIQPCPLAGGGLDRLAQKYAEAVESSKPWTWNDIGKGLTKTQRKKIRDAARDKKLIAVVPLDPKQDYVTPKPDAPFVIFPVKFIKDTQRLASGDWKKSDAVQFKLVNDDLAARNPDYDPTTQTFKGSPKKYTWHHAQSPKGEMQLVEFGIHNATNHSGGRNAWGGGTDSR